MNSDNVENSPIRLTARDTIQFDRREYSAGQRFDCDVGDAVPWILDGHAELFGAQYRPPAEVIDAIWPLVDDISSFGPRAIFPKAIEKFEKNVLSGGRRMNAVSGKALHWLAGRRELERAMLDLLPLGSDRLLDLIKQLEGTWSARLGVVHTETRTQRYTAEQMEEQGLFLPKRQPERPSWLKHDRDYDRIPAKYEYVIVGSSWVRFRRDLDALRDMMDTTVLKALREGRVLAVVESDGVARLQPPWSWNESTGIGQLARKTHYLFSKDLPEAWLPKTRQVRGEERKLVLEQARKILERRYRDAAPNHNEFKKGIIISQVAAELNVSENLVAEAWRMANIPFWQKSGRRKSSQ